ncbi:MAG: FRG domain-containing protein [Syntrophales bacterium]|jgi:hypothetical protein
MKPSHLLFTESKGIQTNKKSLTSLQEFLDCVHYFERKWGNNRLWFRGISNSNYELKPSIYRKEIWSYDVEEAKEVCSEFIRRGKPFANKQSVNSKWEWYHLMQHYGVPTRLLDWTEGALIGLFFAVRKIKNKNTPCVLLVDPFRLNKLSANQTVLYYLDPVYREKIDDKVLKYFDDEAELPDYPVALLPPHLDERIVSQQSVFIIFGKRRNGLVDIVKKKADKKPRLVKLCIDQRKLHYIRNQLATAGITESSLFPDLEGLARDIRRGFNMK